MKNPENKNLWVEEIKYSQTKPRCSLDMLITLSGGRTIDDSIMRLQSFSGSEEISQPYTYNLECVANDYVSGGLPHDANQIRGARLSGLNPQAHPIQSGKRDFSAQSFKENFSEKEGASFLFDEIIGSKISIRIGLPETEMDISRGNYPGSETDKNRRPISFFNGIVTGFAMAERGKYHLEVKPAIFRLSLQSHYRIFEAKTIVDVVKSVLRDNAIAAEFHSLGLANYRKQDWIQTGETDLDFITGLMKKVNLFYYFKHTDTNQQMVITDQAFYQPIYERKINQYGFTEEDDEKIKSLLLSYSEGGQDRDDYISDFKYQENLTTAGIHTMLAQKHATWEEVNTSIVDYYENDDFKKPLLNMEQMHVVQYGATDYEAKKRSDTANKKISAGKASLDGKSGCSDLKPGHFFNVKEVITESDLGLSPIDYPKGKGVSEVSSFYSESGKKNSAFKKKNKQSEKSPVRPELSERLFVAVSVSHNASVDGSYSNQFSAVDAKGLVTKFESSGDHQGNILAVVVEGPGSIKKESMEHTQRKYFKKSTVFDHDTKDFKYVEESEANRRSQSYSCKGVFVRFVNAQDKTERHWIKLASHMTTVPEIGSFVMVGKSSDETEVPEIQQTLESKGSSNIMPEGYTVHTSVGNSFSTNYGDSTSISMGGNKKTPLKRAQDIVDDKRATGQYNHVSFSESDSFNYSLTGKSHNFSFTGHHQPLPPADDSDDRDLNDYVQYSHSLTVGNTFSKSISNGTSESVSVHNGGGEDQLCSVSSSLINGKTESKSIHNGDSKSVSVQTGNSDSSSVVSDSAHSSVIGSSANSSVTGSTISSSITGTSASTSITGATASGSVVGASASGSVTGVSVHSSLTGSSESQSATGMSNNISATGTSTNISTTGVSTNISAVGISTSVQNIGASSDIKNGPGSLKIELTGTDMEILSALKMVL